MSHLDGLTAGLNATTVATDHGAGPNIRASVVPRDWMVLVRSGKLPPQLLGRLLARIASNDPRVTLGPRPGEDAAIIDLGNQSLVVTTDPITFVSEHAAWYAVQVNANDIAAMGADPAWLAVTILLPTSSSDADIEPLFQQLRTACNELGVSVVTGHTEVTTSVIRTVIVGTMLGLAPAGDAVTSGGALIGDAVILAGPIAVEGTATLATEAATVLRDKGLTRKDLAVAAGLLFHPGISVVPASRVIRRVTRPHALHDATEGGVATALREVAFASGVGMRLNSRDFPVLSLTTRICEALVISPMGLISSGCLIAVVAANDAESVVAGLEAEGIVAAVAGYATANRDVVLRTESGAVGLPEFDRDELARYLDENASG